MFPFEMTKVGKCRECIKELIFFRPCCSGTQSQLFKSKSGEKCLLLNKTKAAETPSFGGFGLLSDGPAFPRMEKVAP